MSQKRVLCVCKGNTCRSPMMEAMLRHELNKAGVHDFTVISAGMLKEAEGQDANEHSVNELARRGIGLVGHKSQHISRVGDLSVSGFDMIICVDEATEAEVLAQAPDAFVVTEVPNRENGGIPNPWQQGPEVYAACADLIEAQMQHLAAGLARRWKEST